MVFTNHEIKIRYFETIRARVTMTLNHEDPFVMFVQKKLISLS